MSCSLMSAPLSSETLKEFTDQELIMMCELRGITAVKDRESEATMPEAPKKKGGKKDTKHDKDVRKIVLARARRFPPLIF